MRASIEHLKMALHAEQPPRDIWQQPFDYDPGHYKRLCSIKGAPPQGSDLQDYAHDMLYEQTPLQPDLFRYLLPICLEAWRQDLLANGDSEYGGFVEYFWVALAERPHLQEHLTVKQLEAVEAFMADTLLDRLEQENRLRFSGSNASPYSWVCALGSFAIVFPTLPKLWNRWWKLTTPGLACAALQYLSCLLYENNQNPIFSPWTPEGGGGPPALWAATGFALERGWRQENVDFLAATLTPSYVEDKIREAAQVLLRHVENEVPQRILADFEAQQTLLEMRLEELPSLLLAWPLACPKWTV